MDEEVVEQPGCNGGRRGKRREAMLCAAHALFVERGFENTTLSQIVGRSGGSLATLYELFENKPGMLRALVRERCLGIQSELDAAIAEGRPYRNAIRAIAEEMLDRFLDPDYIGLFRVVVAQCAGHPDLGQQIYDSGPAVCQAKTGQYFATQIAAGTLAPGDPLEIAKMFFQMVCGDLLSQLVFGLPVALTAEQRTRHLDFVLPVFTRAFAADAQRQPSAV